MRNRDRRAEREQRDDVEMVEISNSMIDKFVNIDLQILEKQLKSDLSNDKTNTIINLLVNLFDETKYDDKNFHIYLLPYLPNNEKFIVTQGHNNKPLMLMSLYNVNGDSVTRNIETYDTSNLGCNYLSEYISNKIQLKKFEELLDELINGDKQEIERLKKLRESLQERINQSKNTNIDDVLKRYNCIQNDLINLYSKNVETVEVRKLRRLRMKGNYKGLVKDTIKKLQEEDNEQIKSLSKESNELKVIIDKSNKSITAPLLEELKMMTIDLLDYIPEKKMPKK